MNAEAMVMPETDERNSERVQFDGPLSYRYDLNEHGFAKWCSVGREGACISLGRYLRPGRHVTLMSGSEAEGPLEISGRIVWCRPTSDGREFVAGLRIFDDGRYAAPVQSYVGQAS